MLPKIKALWSYRYWFLSFLVLVLSLLALRSFNAWRDDWKFSLRSPIQNFVVIEPVEKNLITYHGKTEAYALVPESEAAWTAALLWQLGTEQGLNSRQIHELEGISLCESGLRNVPNKLGTSSALGAFQILKMHDSKGDRTVTEGNIRVAIKLYKQQGTTPWKASQGCWKNL